MLPSFYILRFRLFDELNLSKLGRVNLIVGRNNTGKSALLEALYLHGAGFNLGTLAKIAGLKKPLYLETTKLRHLFHQRVLAKKLTNCLAFGESKALAKYLFLGAYTRDNNNQLVLDETSKAPDAEWFLTTGISGTKEQRLFPVDTKIHTNGPVPEPNLKGPQLAPTHALSSVVLGALFDQVHLTDAEEQVVEAMQIIDPGIKGVGFIQGEDQERVPIIRHQQSNEPLPLSTMGDGLQRILQLVLCMVNAKNSLLLLDEVETGFHYRVHPNVWHLIFDLSKKLDIQVVATTHSMDCIKAYKNVWGEQPNDGTFIRLQRKGESIVPVYYAHENLEDALDTDVEVR